MNLILPALALLPLAQAPFQEPTRGSSQEVASASQEKLAKVPWLVRNQGEGGLWAADEGADQLAVSALALFAFLGDGHTTKVGPHAQAVQRGFQGLLAQQDAATGWFPSEVEEGGGVLTQALCCLALSELHVLDPDPSRLGAQALAVAALLKRQNKDGGFGDGRTTGWAAMAMTSARDVAAGEGPRQELTDAIRRAQRNLERWVVVNPEQEGFDRSLLAQRCLAGFFVGKEDEPAMKAMQRVTSGDSPFEGLDPEGRMLISLAAYQCGGTTWRQVNQNLKAAVVDQQITSPAANLGAFPAEGDFGTARATALGAVTVQVYFRYSRVLSAR